MKTLENTVPPPFVALLAGAGMWAANGFALPTVPLSPLRASLFTLTCALSLAIAGTAMWTFARVRTTIDPVNIKRASSLVTNGVFRLTRNPMYVGLAGALISWAVLLNSPPLLLGPVVFIAFIDRLQILPEERMMSAKFGQDYAEYKSRVRRWL